MHISVICDLDACIYDAGFFRYQRTDGQGDSRSWMLEQFMMHVSLMPVSMMHIFSVNVPMVHISWIHVSIMYVRMMHADP